MEIRDLYDKKITILNKLKKSDSATGLDVWYKTFIEEVGYYTKKTTNVNGTTVSMGQTIEILIPFNDDYLPYTEWKKAGQQIGHFTVSQGDYIILGEHIEEIVTPATVQTVKNKYEPNVCDVRVITELNRRGGAFVQLKIEGV